MSCNCRDLADKFMTHQQKMGTRPTNQTSVQQPFPMATKKPLKRGFRRPSATKLCCRHCVDPGKCSSAHATSIKTRDYRPVLVEGQGIPALPGLYTPLFLLRSDPHLLGVHEGMNTVWPQLATVAGTLDAATGQARIGFHQPIYHHLTCFHLQR